MGQVWSDEVDDAESQADTAGAELSPTAEETARIQATLVSACHAHMQLAQPSVGEADGDGDAGLDCPVPAPAVIDLLIRRAQAGITGLLPPAELSSRQ